MKSKPAEAIPKVEAETKIRELEAKVTELEAKLAESIPKREADELRGKIRVLEEIVGKLREFESMFAGAQTRTIELNAKIRELERSLAESIPKSELEALQVKFQEVEHRLTESIPKAEAEAKIQEIAAKLAEARTELEMAKARIKELEAEKAAASS